MARAKRRRVYFQARPEEYEPEEPTFTPELAWFLRFVAKWLLVGIAIVVLGTLLSILQSPKRHYLGEAASSAAFYLPDCNLCYFQYNREPMVLTLEVKERGDKDSSETLRAKGLVPAVFYGPKEASTAIAIDSQKLERVWREAGETTLVKLTGAGSEKDTLIHDIQVHPVTGKVLHADFYVIEKGKKVTIKVPLEFVGTAPAEKLGGIAVKALHEVEIEVAPAELPHHLEVNMASLEAIGAHVTAKDIALPPSAELKTAADEIVVSIVEFKEEKEEAPAAVVPAEIIGEKKEGEGETAEGEKKE